MESEWKTSSLADAIEIISGGTPKTNVPEYWNGNIPWLSVADFNTGYRWVSTAEKSITERGLKESATTLLQRGDVIISARGTVGATAQVSRPMAFNQSCYGIRGRAGIADTNYIFYALQHAVTEMKQMAHGGVFETITRSTFEIVECKFPSLPEQIKIADVLGSLDNRIENNQALAANLEAIARRLFMSWFVDFDPVRAKAAGEKPVGLADDLAALFPVRFVDSELGEIPEGWKVGNLSDVCELNPETWSARKHPDVLEYIDLSNVKSGDIEEVTSYLWDESPSRARRVLRCGDTIVGTVRPGNRSFALIATDGLTGSTGFAVLRPSHPHHREYLYLAATADDAIERLAHLADGAAYPAVRPDVVTCAEAVIPNDEIMRQFAAITSPMFGQIAVCQSEASVLSSLRDLLLPRLISGKLRVADAETLIEEAIA